MFKEFVEVKPLVWFIIGLVVVAFLVFMYSKSKKNNGTAGRLYTQRVIYGGLSIALAFVLSYIRFYHWPQGGSITPASMLPMFLFAFMFGPVAGIIAGIAYGFLQFIQDPYVVHWAQVLLDYPLAFGAMGIAGLYRKNLAVSSFIGGFGRFFMHFLSGAIFFGQYAPEGMNVFVYSLSVNGVLIGTEVIICIAVAIALQCSPVLGEVRKTIKLN